MASPKANEPRPALQVDAPTASRRSSNSDVFCDTNALNPFEVPALPSPTADGDRHVQATHHPSSLLHRPVSLQPSLQSRLDSQRRSSSSQRYLRRSSLSARREPSTTTFTYLPNATSDRGNAISQSIPHRVTSNASRMTIPRPESPYRGTSGPSHPYAMYPQDIGVGRTPSNATGSTTRTPARSYTGPSRPTHPYGMYAQDTTSEDELSAGAPATPLVPLGFAGRGHRYQRRLEPQGEDVDDFIGVDGHTEQLPPYTRYAYDLPPKESPVEPGPIATTEHDPFGDSQVTLNAISLQQTHNWNAVPAAISSPRDTEVIADSRPADEGGHLKESFAEKSKKRICRLVPLWLLVVLIFMILVVVGAAVGASLHHEDDHTETQEAPPLQSATPVA